MASIISKRVHGRTYYYVAESERVDGKPRIVAQRYLGTAEDIDALLGGVAATPEHTRHLAFGTVAAVWRTIERLGVADLVDAHVGRQRASVSVGTYVALAVLHRAAAPRDDLPRWWWHTAADRFVRPHPPGEAFEHAAFWRAMRRLGPHRRQRVEADVAAELRRRIDPAEPATPALVVDVPNAATLLAPSGAQGPPEGVSLLVSQDGAIPLGSLTYPRGRPDGASFGAAAAQLAARHRAVTSPRAEVTAIYDASQRIPPAARSAEHSGTHFVGGLPLGDHADLLTRPAAARGTVDQQRLPGLTALDTSATVHGVRSRVLVTHSTTLHAAQARGFTQALNQATRQLDELADTLATGASQHSHDQVLAEVARITRVPWVERVLHTSLSGAKPGHIRLRWRVDEDARARVDEDYFGKQLLITDHDDWPAADVLTAYRARYHLDSTLRQLDAPLPAQPPQNWRWSGERVATYRFVSLLVTTVLHLMRQQATRAGLDLSVRELFEHLAGMQETVLRYPSTGGRPRTHRVLTDHTDIQQRLYDIFDLQRYAPRRARRT